MCSHRFPKMYIVRPQFFLPIITLLRNAAMNSLKYKSELALVKLAEHVDITEFRNQPRNEFKTAFRSELATSHPTALKKAIDEHRQIHRPPAENQGCSALGSQTGTCVWQTTRREDVTIKKLTRGNPTMAAKFAELKNPGLPDAE